eukprot:1377924-Alexandrium_andersonii.AAC.1
MAPGFCTCGGWYAKRSCTSPTCRSPEGPVQRSRRLCQQAAYARVAAQNALASGSVLGQAYIA